MTFQNGPIAENGVNGSTNEAYLAIVGHRLDCFARGPFPSGFNAIALAGCEIAQTSLALRTEDRQNRGVEGKSQA